MRAGAPLVAGGVEQAEDASPEVTTEMLRSRSMPIHSERVLRRFALARTSPASWIAPPNNSIFSVSVVALDGSAVVYGSEDGLHHVDLGARRRTRVFSDCARTFGEPRRRLRSDPIGAQRGETRLSESPEIRKREEGLE